MDSDTRGFVFRSPLLPLLLAGLTACGGSGDAQAVAGVRDTLPNGAERVRYGPLPNEAPGPLAPDLRIGVLEGEQPYVFGDVRGIEAGPDGTIYVLDHQAAEIRIFGPDGAFQGYAARRGQGPGEIVSANGIARAPDGTLWVQDHGQWQLIRLAPGGGEMERMHMFVLQYGFLWDGIVDEAGRIWTGWSRFPDASAPGQPPQPGPQETTVEEFVIAYGPATGVADTIRVARTVARSYVVALEGGWAFRAVPFQAAHLKAVDPAGPLWSAMSDAYWIARLDSRGDTTLVIQVEHPPAAVTSADREAFVAAARERGPDEERVARELVRAMPERKPVLAGLVVDDEGRLWVRRYAADADDPPHFDVFDRTGGYLGSVRLAFRTPARFAPRIRNRRLYTLAVDEYDVPSVVRVEVELEGG